MSFESVDIFVLDDDSAGTPVEGATVRVFDSTGALLITSQTTDATGRAAFLLASGMYQLRVFKDRYTLRNPHALTVLDLSLPANAGLTNRFDLVGHVFKPPEAVDPRLCRCSGFFIRPDGSPAPHHDVHIIAKFDPILVDGKLGLTERVHTRTDKQGYVEFDLIRLARYQVTLEDFSDCVVDIRVPDLPSANFPDLCFPVVERVEFDREGPFEVPGVGTLNELVVGVTVFATDGLDLPDSGIRDVIWATSDASVAVVLPTNNTLVLRGLAPGVTTLTAERRDKSIVRIPDTPIEGVPVTITVQ